MNYYEAGSLLIRPMLAADAFDFAEAFQRQHSHKPIALFEEYLALQEQGALSVFVATINNAVAGYVTLLPQALAGPFANQGIPEIKDFNVLIAYQRMGIGAKVLDIVEGSARTLAASVSLGVGLHAGYGTAQRMYIKRGYIPDGSGVWYHNAPLTPYSSCQNDDDLVLYLKKAFCRAG